MKITIDQVILDKYNLSIEDFFILYLSAKNIDINKCAKSLVKRGLAEKSLFTEDKIVITCKIKNLITDIILESDKNTIGKDEEFTALANKLQELYPSGRKDGTSYMWRGTTAEIAKKLKTLVVKYGYTFSEEQAINATKNYIESHNGNYKTMRLLKYFILKSEKDADDNINTTSDLMTFIENEKDINNKRNDWTSTMI